MTVLMMGSVPLGSFLVSLGTLPVSLKDILPENKKRNLGKELWRKQVATFRSDRCRGGLCQHSEKQKVRL